jgi:hypothetical protein
MFLYAIRFDVTLVNKKPLPQRSLLGKTLATATPSPPLISSPLLWMALPASGGAENLIYGWSFSIKSSFAAI